MNRTLHSFLIGAGRAIDIDPAPRSVYRYNALAAERIRRHGGRISVTVDGFDFAWDPAVPPDVELAASVHHLAALTDVEAPTAPTVERDPQTVDG